MSRFAAWVFSALALVAGCSSSPSSPSSPPDLAVDPCRAGVVPLSYFLDGGTCAPTYAAALTRLTCDTRAAGCAGYDVVGSPGPYELLDCFYDHGSGDLVGAYVFSDIGPSCSAGSAHQACPVVSYPSCESDAGP